MRHPIANPAGLNNLAMPFSAINAAQTGELPFLEMGGGGVEGTAFGGGEHDRKPLQPEGSSNEVAERGAGTQAKAFAVGTATSPAKKTAAVMQAVVAKEQRQMEMDLRQVQRSKNRPIVLMSHDSRPLWRVLMP